MELDISLMTCPECNSVFQYYDFLSHTSHMCNSNSNTISDMHTEFDEDENMNEDEENGDRYDNIDEYDNEYINNSLTNLNGLNDYGNYRNLYNPMINRNFNINININNTNTNTNTNNISNNIIDTNTLINNFEAINIINETNDTFKYNVKKDLDLEKYNKKIQCNERTECSICLVSYPEHTTFYLMNCNHSFCIECCEKWYSTNSLCPLCRSHY